MLRALRILWAVGMNVSMAALFLLVWFRPYALGERSVRQFAVFYLVEFIAIHATFYWAYTAERLSTRSDRFGAFFISGIMYTIAMGFVSLVSGNLWVLVFFWAMMFSHFSVVVLRLPGQEDKSFAVANWGIMLGLWVACLFLTLTFIPMPAFGITPEVIAALRSSDESLRGVLVDEPYRCIAFGVAYFAGLSVWSLIRELTSRRPAVNIEYGRSE